MYCVICDSEGHETSNHGALRGYPSERTLKGAESRLRNMPRVTLREIERALVDRADVPEVLALVSVALKGVPSL